MSKLWEDTLTHLELNLSSQHYSTWIKPLKLIKIEQDMVYLEVPNRFVLDWVKDNYSKLIQKILEELSAVNYRLQFNVAGQARDGLSRSDEKPEPRDMPVDKQKKVTNNTLSTDINLNRKYTFEEFVSGSSNQFAYAAAMAVANNPATTYNPLFIYGGVGLGKTHLVNAIGNAILKKSPEMRICYYTSEKFMNELINSLRYNRMDEFRNKFRSMDVILIDDIQFIAGKERTQEEFFLPGCFNVPLQHIHAVVPVHLVGIVDDAFFLVIGTHHVHHHLIDKMLNVGFLGIDHNGNVVFEGGFTKLVHPLAAGGVEIEQPAADDDGGKERSDDADRQGHREAADRPGAEHEQEHGGDQGRDVGVEDGGEGLLVACVDRGAR